MDETKKEIAIWGGIPLIVIIVFMVALDSSAEVKKKKRELNGLAKEYKQLYLNPEANVAFATALGNANENLGEQVEHYEVIKQRAAPTLPSAYTTDNYTKASARATEDLEAVRKYAERNGVGLPSGMPNADALKVEPHLFSQQLAQLFLFRNTADILIQKGSAGTLDITNISLGSSFTDASGSLAVFEMNFAIQIDFRSLEKVLRSLNNNKLGISIREFDIEVPEKNQVLDRVPFMKVTMTVGLCTDNNPDWGFKPLGAAASSQATGGARRTRGGHF